MINTNNTNLRSVSPRLILPNKLSYLPLAINFVRDVAGVLGFHEKEIRNIEVAVEEAVSNVIRHAFSSDENAEFHIICESIPLGLKIIIKDKGLPFDPTIVPVYKPDNVEKDTAVNGLGMYLIKQFMDELSFHNLGRDGKEIHLIKYLQQKPLENEPSGVDVDDIKESKNKKTVTTISAPFKIRKAKKSEMVEIAKCAYDAYGYSYGQDHIYYPDRMWALIKSGLIISAVAVTDDDRKEIIAHNALIFDDPNDKIAEMGMAFTKHKQQACARKLGLYLFNEAVKKGIIGILIDCTTSHVYTQRLTLGAGARECCILLGIDPQAQSWKHFVSQGQRGSNIITYKKVPLPSTKKSLERKRDIYAPEQHRKMIEKIYANLDEEQNFVNMKESNIDLPEKLSVIKVHTGKSYQQTAAIEIESYGSDIVRQISQTLKNLCLEKFEAIYLYFNLQDPLTAVMTKKFESLGFFFAGIIPGADRGDKLELQYLNNVKIDYKKIQVYSTFSKELLAYIQGCDQLTKSL